MCHYCYIIYSKSLNRFYVGETSDFEQRLSFHNLGFSEFTSKATDWELFLLIECRDRAMASAIERHIKSMKSGKYIRNLVKYPEIVTKLKVRFSDP